MNLSVCMPVTQPIAKGLMTASAKTRKRRLVNCLIMPNRSSVHGIKLPVHYTLLMPRNFSVVQAPASFAVKVNLRCAWHVIGMDDA